MIREIITIKYPIEMVFIIMNTKGLFLFFMFIINVFLWATLMTLADVFELKYSKISKKEGERVK